MRRIFLGRPIHWALIAVLVAGGYWLGDLRLHVREFNLFVIVLIIATVALLALTLRTSRPGDYVTRDPIPEPEDD